MPPVSSQGSRTAAITWAVVFAILFVTASIFAIVFYANASKTELASDTFKKQYNDIVSEAELNSDAVGKLKALRTEEGSGFNPSMPVFQAMPVFQVAVAQRDQMAQMLAGAGGKETAEADARQALAVASKAGKDAGMTVPTTDNVAGALTTLANGLSASVRLTKDLQGQLDEAKKQNTAQAAQFEAQRGEMNKTLEQVRGEQQNAVAQTTTYQQSKDQSIQQIEQGMAGERKVAQDNLNAASVQIAELSRQLTSANQKIETLQNKFADKRVNTQDPIVRHPDGRIIRMPARDIVYIDLGSAESVTPGLTFEVYDKVDGIPTAGDPATDNNLPRGKASIEVVRVGAGSSECRVTRQTPGTQMTEGDLVANLIYDRDVKYNFIVYGDFDIDRNDVATAQDADIIKRLITQWGGKLKDVVNVDTDFVVLGKEPVLPTFNKEELQDPFNAKKLADAQVALDAYLSVRKTAADLHIPIVNQNRFLYLIGYYDQARR